MASGRGRWEMSGGSPILEHIEIGDNNMITDESVISRDNSSYRLKVTRNVYDKIIISVFCKQRAEFPWRWRPIHTRDFAPGACSRGTLREQSSSGVYQRVHGYTSSSRAEFPPRKMLHDIQPVKYLAESARGKLSELENAPSCVYWHVQNEPGHAPGAKPVVCIDP